MVIDLETTITAWLASRRGSVTPQPYERLCTWCERPFNNFGGLKSASNFLLLLLLQQLI